MKVHELRGFSILEHGCSLKYDIELNKENKYFESFKGSDIEGTVCRFETDENGFINPSRIYEEADYNIFFMGDSTVECSFVQPEKRYPYLVGRLLEKKTNIKINSYNAGVSGADTLSLMKVLLMKIFPMEPNMIVLCNTDRELIYLLSKNEMDIRHLKGVENGKERIVAYRDWVLKASLKRKLLVCGEIIFSKKEQLTGRGLQKKKSNIMKIEVDEESVLACFKNDLIAFISLCQTRKIHLILMTQANQYVKTNDKRLKELYEINTYKQTHIDYEQYCKLYAIANDMIRQIGVQNNVCVIDLEEFAKQKHLLYDAVHYTNEGSVIVSEYISTKIYNELK